MTITTTGLVRQVEQRERGRFRRAINRLRKETKENPRLLANEKDAVLDALDQIHGAVSPKRKK